MEEAERAREGGRRRRVLVERREGRRRRARAPRLRETGAPPRRPCGRAGGRPNRRGRAARLSAFAVGRAARRPPSSARASACVSWANATRRDRGNYNRTQSGSFHGVVRRQPVGPYEIRRPSARAAWARSTARVTRGSAARWRSRCCKSTWPPIPRRWGASSARRGPSRRSPIRTSSRSTTSGSRTDVVLLGHRAPPRRDASRAARPGVAFLAEGGRNRGGDRRRPRGGARAGHRPPGPEAGERLPDRGRTGEDPRLRPGAARAGCAPEEAGSAVLDGLGRRSPARSWAPPPTCRPSRYAGFPWTRGATSSRSDPCSTRW